MQIRRKCHRNIWVLSGTGDGPPIVNGLIAKGYEVSVSVVSFQASLPYSHMPLKNLWVGALQGKDDIRRVIENSFVMHDGFDCVIDATHPFAQKISSSLKTVCLELDQPLVRFERYCKTISKAVLIAGVEELINLNFIGQKILFAIGGRLLPKALYFAKKSGAVSFARVLPTTEGILAGLVSELPQANLAVVRPSKREQMGELEAALCRKWGITGIVARESGGITQDIWQNISLKQNLNLWLIARPTNNNYDCIVKTKSELFDYF